MTTGGVALCPACVHLRADGPVSVCAAYPEGIPDSIWLGADHRRPQPGDHGVHFELADTPDASVLLAAYRTAYPEGGPDVGPDTEHQLPDPFDLPEAPLT